MTKRLNKFTCLVAIGVLLVAVGIVYLWRVTMMTLDHEAERRAAFREIAVFNASYMRRNHVPREDYMKELQSFERAHEGWYFEEYVRTVYTELEK